MRTPQRIGAALGLTVACTLGTTATTAWAAAPAVPATGHHRTYTDADIAPLVQVNTRAEAATAPVNNAVKTARAAAAVAARRSAHPAATPSGAEVVPALNNNKTLSSTNNLTKTPPGGSAGTIRAHGYSAVKVPFFETSANYTNNEAHVYWFGASPFNAKSVTETETWANSGVDISLSFPLGGSLSGTGATATDTNVVSNNWQINAYTDSVRFSAFDIYRVRHSVAGKFQFGTTFFTVTTTDDSLV